MKELLVVGLVLVAKAIFSRIVGEEFSAMFTNIASWLVRKSARMLTADAERYEEQWLADLADRKTPLRKLLFGVDMLRAAVVLRGESPRVPASRKKAEPSDSSEPVIELEGTGYAKVTLDAGEDPREKLLNTVLYVEFDSQECRSDGYVQFSLPLQWDSQPIRPLYIATLEVSQDRSPLQQVLDFHGKDVKRPWRNE